MKLTIEVVTPEKIIYSGEAEMVIAPAVGGDVGILPRHIPLFSRLKIGELQIKRGGQTEYFAINGGFLDVKDNKVTILTETARRSDQINEQEVLEAKERAETIMKESKTKEDFAAAEASLRRSLLELKVVRRKNRKGTETPQSL